MQCAKCICITYTHTHTHLTADEDRVQCQRCTNHLIKLKAVHTHTRRLMRHHRLGLRWWPPCVHTLPPLLQFRPPFNERSSAHAHKHHIRNYFLIDGHHTNAIACAYTLLFVFAANREDHHTHVHTFLKWDSRAPKNRPTVGATRN